MFLFLCIVDNKCLFYITKFFVYLVSRKIGKFAFFFLLLFQFLPTFKFIHALPLFRMLNFANAVMPGKAPSLLLSLKSSKNEYLVYETKMLHFFRIKIGLNSLLLTKTC